MKKIILALLIGLTATGVQAKSEKKTLEQYGKMTVAEFGNQFDSDITLDDFAATPLSDKVKANSEKLSKEIRTAVDDARFNNITYTELSTGVFASWRDPKLKEARENYNNSLFQLAMIGLDCRNLEKNYPEEAKRKNASEFCQSKVQDLIDMVDKKYGLGKTN
ncbi:hypothetical protein [Lonepinella sp. BR2474]|uniref:hypothetical protein n=1 Tax=Lonepinella sp. BR2474 TaxID=3434548 RepID=UPI003F6E287B